MCWQCDNPASTTADLRSHLLRVIDDHGWLVQFVEPHDPLGSLAYTVGLTAHGCPELVVEDLSASASAGLLNEMARACMSEPLQPDEIFHARDGRGYLLAVMPWPEELYVATMFYGSSVRALTAFPQ